jgi:hypothetical protein
MTRPSTWAWILVHIVFPLIPVPIEGVLRLLAANNVFHTNTFNAATLALSWGLICLFVNQSLRTKENWSRKLNDADEQDRQLACTLMNMFAIGCFVCFGACVTYNALIEQGHHDLANTMSSLELIIFFAWPFPLTAAIKIQRSFRLRASLA